MAPLLLQEALSTETPNLFLVAALMAPGRNVDEILPGNLPPGGTAKITTEGGDIYLLQPLVPCKFVTVCVPADGEVPTYEGIGLITEIAIGRPLHGARKGRDPLRTSPIIEIQILSAP